MTPPASRESSATLRETALSLPDVEEGIACAGTSLESRTVKVRGKAFLFLGPKEVRLKLGPSLADAENLAKAHPGTVKPGKGGWVAVANGTLAELPSSLLRSWVRESYGVFGGGTATGSVQQRGKRGR